jgi:hypothetical protein
MANKQKTDTRSKLGNVAETVGRALGTVVGKAEAVVAAHPNPMGEARELVSAGQEKVDAVRARAEKAVDSAKQMVDRATTGATRAAATARKATSRARATASRTAATVRRAVKAPARPAANAVRRASTGTKKLARKK